MDQFELVSAPRRIGEVLTNAADLAILLGNVAEAAELLDRAEAAARSIHLDRLLVDVLVGRADFHIACSEHERAWPLVERALEHSGSRTLIAGGRFERVKRHFVWATKGYDVLRSLPPVSQYKGLSISLAHKLEIAALEEWIARAEGIPAGRRRCTVQELAQRGLFGVIARLLMLHTYVGDLPRQHGHYSSAQLVKRLFHDYRPGSVPRSVGVPRQSA